MTTPSDLTHAGGVVRRDADNRIVMLIVRSRRAPYHWVLPKGHIETGETPDQCARREVQEEAGVDAIPAQYLGESRHVAMSGEPVHAGWFLMRFAGNVPAHEHREIRWCTLAEARDLIRFENMRHILTAAERIILEHADP